jgi:cytochrome c-type biogenesis protein CcmE
MTTFAKKLCTAGILLAAGLGYLAYAGSQQGWVYYVSVDQFAKDTAQQKHRVRLMGRVGNENLVIEGAQLRARFQVESNGAVLPVSYRGTIPDLFKAGADVVVEGKLNPAGTFEADVLLTKCASKYDAKHTAIMEKRS